MFGDALDGLPPAPRHFILYFRFESEELTDESRAPGAGGAVRRSRRGPSPT